MKKIYSLTSEDLTHLGGSMGTEYSTTNWIKYFTTINLAKAYALKDYRITDKNLDIKWRGNHSGDLRWVSYDIKTIKVTA